MKTIREYIDLIENAQTPVAEAYTPSAGELARDLIKMSPDDFGKKYGMSKQQAEHHYSSSKLKEQDIEEAIGKKDLLARLQKDLSKVNDPENTGDPNAWAKGDLYTGARDQEDIDQMSRRDTSEPRPTAAQRAKDLGMRNKRNGLVEDPEHKEYEHLSELFAHLYYGDFSATEQIRLANKIYDNLVSGVLSTEQVRADIRELSAELNNQQQIDDYFDQKEQDIEEDQATARMGLMSAMGSNSGEPDRQRMAAQAIERMAQDK